MTLGAYAKAAFQGVRDLYSCPKCGVTLKISQEEVDSITNQVLERLSRDVRIGVCRKKCPICKVSRVFLSVWKSGG